jgi:hypothetical protein
MPNQLGAAFVPCAARYRPKFKQELLITRATKKVVRGDVMLDDDEIDPAKLDVDILFDVPDDALERAAGVALGQAVTVGYCTQWYTCGWPL